MKDSKKLEKKIAENAPTLSKIIKQQQEQQESVSSTAVKNNTLSQN